MEKQQNILIGNGFNIALQNNVLDLNLDYKSIRSFMIEHCKNIPTAFKILKESELDDIEIILKDVADENTRMIIKDSLIAAIINSLEKNSSKFSQSQEISCHKHIAANNLRSFDNIFTLNYDLILCWLLASERLFDKFRDGFWFDVLIDRDMNCKLLLFGQYSNVNFYYVHGAIHLIHNYQNQPSKIAKNINIYGNDLISLRQVLIDKYKDLKNILVISPDYCDKSKYMAKSSYLVKCYNALCNIHGDLIIYGSSMIDQIHNSKDQHIIQALCDSNLSNIYCGFFEQPKDEQIKKFVQLVTNHGLRNVKIFKYATNSINIWNDNNFINRIHNESININ